MATAEALITRDMKVCWAEGVLDTESWSILPSLRGYHAFSRLEINQLDKDISEFGKNTAGAVLTQMVRYSPIPNQSTGVSNEGFI